MAAGDGADLLTDAVVPKQELNRYKNHHRGTVVPDALTPGALFSKSTTNELHHTTVTGTEGPKILQGNIVCANNEVVCANNEVVFAGII